jgi:TonB family protein
VKLVPHIGFYTRRGQGERNSRAAAEINDSILVSLMHFLLLTSGQFGHNFAKRRFAEPSRFSATERFKMADLSSGIPLPSRDTQEFAPVRPWPTLPSEQTDATNSKASLALAILSEKIKSGAMQRSELMKRIVAQAFAATAAKGVALALRSRPGTPVVCCASEGDMAPPPGTPLDESSGFTAECLKKGTFIVCEDSETDARVERLVCARLGVRSIVAVPVENDGATVGVLEALSDQQAAFSKQHIEVLLTLACFAKSVAEPAETDAHLEAAHTRSAAVVIAAPALPLPGDALPDHAHLTRIEDLHDWSERVPRRVRLAIAGGVAAALLLALFATAILLWMWRQNGAQVGKATKPQPQQAFGPKPFPGLGANPSPHGSMTRSGSDSERKSVVLKASAIEKIATAEPRLVPSEIPSTHAADDNVTAPDAFTPISKEHTAELTAALASGENLPAASVATSQGAKPASLKHRVEPVYPADAKRLRIEGAVVLRAAIDEAGDVKSVGVVNGNPILANAAMAAVRQWRYTPSELNHHPAASTTDITIVFHLQ